ncbi:MAG: hypothetical protein KKB50_16625 [Planctomycetes bacterium]|nr:hypothetical protein [Planctomycetota bacterium]
MAETRVSLIRRVDASGVPLLLARVATGGWFLYLAGMKISDPFEFLKQVHAYGIVPESPVYLLNSVAIVLPMLEIVCAAALLLGLWVRGAATVIGLMLLAFLPALLYRAWIIYQAGDMAFCDVCFDCGCGTGVVCICHKAAENTALFVGALIGLFSCSRRWCLSGWFGRVVMRPAPVKT